MNVAGLLRDQVMELVDNVGKTEDEAFKLMCRQIHSGCELLDVGYVRDAKGQYFRIERSERVAKKVTDEKEKAGLDVKFTQGAK